MNVLETCAVSAVTFEQAAELFKAAGYNEYQLVPGLPTSSWCALLPGEAMPELGGTDDNYLGWFSSHRETIETVVNETIAPMAMRACRAPMRLWEQMPYRDKLNLITRLTNDGVFKS